MELIKNLFALQGDLFKFGKILNYLKEGSPLFLPALGLTRNVKINNKCLVGGYEIKQSLINYPYTLLEVDRSVLPIRQLEPNCIEIGMKMGLIKSGMSPHLAKNRLRQEVKSGIT